MIQVTELGYVGIGVSDLAAWRLYASDILGWRWFPTDRSGPFSAWTTGITA